MQLDSIASDIRAVLQELLEMKCIKENTIFVVGCSTSEVIGEVIGTNGSKEVASALMHELQTFAKQANIHLAIQCCEHLNRALVVSNVTQEKFQLEEVAVRPIREAGGALAEAAYASFYHPTIVEHVTAHAGIDIGQTLIGMHLKHVAVPLRLKQKTIGRAIVSAATTRPKLIGGQRAKYSE